MARPRPGGDSAVRLNQAALVALLCVWVWSPGCTHPNPPAVEGVWDATVTVKGLSVPFKFEISGSPPSLAGSFFDGDRRVRSTAAEYDGQRFVFHFDQYGSK